MSYYKREQKQRSDEPHPAWRGIGFILLIGVPILSFFISVEVLAALYRNNITIPEQLQRPEQLILGMGPYADLPAILIFGLIIAIIIFGVFVVINAIIYGASSANTYRSFESPPKQYKKKRKLRKPRYD